MAYVFGAVNTDSVHTTGLTAPFNTNRVAVITCWVYPTTLTATRCLWGSGGTFRLAIDTTTTSLRFTSDMATDGVFTFPAGLVVNTWTFVALLVNIGTSPTMAVKAWTATEAGPITERSVTVATAPVGAITSGGSTFTTGNSTTGGTLAFQGDIGGVALFVDLLNTNLNCICSIAANGALSQDQANQVLAAFVDPLWRGDIGRLTGPGHKITRNETNGVQVIHSLDNFTGGGAWTIKSSGSGRSTNSGCTNSTRRTPRGWDDQPNNSSYSQSRRSTHAVRI